MADTAAAARYRKKEVLSERFYCAFAQPVPSYAHYAGKVSTLIAAGCSHIAAHLPSDAGAPRSASPRIQHAVRMQGSHERRSVRADARDGKPPRLDP